MSPALTLIVPTTKPPPRAWVVAEAVRDQAIAHDAEVLVATSSDPGADAPRDPCRVLYVPGADVFTLRSQAVPEARGEIVAVLEDHNYAADDFCERVLAAFDEHPRADGIVGTATNGAPGLLDRASFLLTWGPFLAPMPDVPLHRCPPPGVVAFRRSALPDDPPPPGWLEYELTVELRDRGRLVADDRVQINHVQHLGLSAFPIQFHAGRGYGGLDHDPRSQIPRRERLRQAIALPGVLVRQTREGLGRGGHRESVACMATVGAYALCNALGQIVGVFRGPGDSTSHLE